jgi:hypothetical protein
VIGPQEAVKEFKADLKKFFADDGNFPLEFTLFLQVTEDILR